MSSYDPRSINPLLTIDERNDIHQFIAVARAEQNDVRQSIEKAEAEVRTLLVQQAKITNNVLQLQKRLVIHRILPREIIGYIFCISRAEQVSIPHKQDKVPPQIAVSHVCSKWREIALSTPSLWNDVELTQPSDEWVQVAIKLLFNRAGIRGVHLALNMEKIKSTRNKMNEIVYDLILPLHVKKLRLTLPLSALENLSHKSDLVIANVDEIALSFTHDSVVIPSQVSIAPQFLSKITVLEWHNQSSLLPPLDLQNLPWSQIRHLCCNIALTLSTIYNILNQSPLLDVCGIKVELDGEPKPTTVLTLPQLRIFHIFQFYFNTEVSEDQDIVLRSFKCPNLTDFRLDSGHWTPETYKIIENHYNLHRLLRFETSGFPYPISKVLFDAPMLQELILYDKAFMDERALQGVASGELGRCLTSLGFNCSQRYFDEKSALDMAASRQRHVKQVVEASRSWQDQAISSIKWIALFRNKVKGYPQLEGELEKLGVIVYHSREPLRLHPLFSLDSECYDL